MGFNEDAITAACRDLELPSVTGSILTNGPYDIVLYAMRHWLKSMTEDITAYTHKTENDKIIPFKDLDLSLKLNIAVKIRLEAQIPYINKWPQAMLIGAQP